MHQIAGSHTPGEPLSDKEEQLSLSMLWEHLTRRLCAGLDSQVARGRLRPVKTALAAALMTRTLLSSIAGRSQGNLARARPSQQEQSEMIATLFCYGLLPRDEQADRH